MSKTITNFLIDVVLLLLTVSLVWSSVILRFVFPPAGAADGWTLWGGSYQQWSDIQFALLATICLSILLHVMMHWSWVCGVVVARVLKRPPQARLDDGTRTLYGVGLLIVLINVVGLLVAWASLSIQGPA